MRLFIATEELKSRELERLRIVFDVDGIKPVERFHLTFKFLGEIDEGIVRRIKERLEEVNMRKFKTKTTRLGVFPNESYMRVVWLGMEDEKINELQKKIDLALKDMFDEEERFHAHITIGRIKFVKNRKEILEKLKIEITQEEFEIDKFVLYKSELTKEGPKYTALGDFKLD